MLCCRYVRFREQTIIYHSVQRACSCVDSSAGPPAAVFGLARLAAGGSAQLVGPVESSEASSQRIDTDNVTANGPRDAVSFPRIPCVYERRTRGRGWKPSHIVHEPCRDNVRVLHAILWPSVFVRSFARRTGRRGEDGRPRRRRQKASLIDLVSRCAFT